MKTEVVIAGLYPSITLPVANLIAALSCAANDDGRYYLNGVYVHHVDGQVRVVATDGHRLLLLSSLLEQEPPDWLDAGIIIPRGPTITVNNKQKLDANGLADRLKMITKLGDDIGATVRISYRAGDARLLLSDLSGECQFRLKPVDGTFPEYQRTLDELDVFEGRELPDMSSMAFASKYLAGVAAVAAAVGSASTRIHGSMEPKKASLITFPGAPHAVLILSALDQQKIPAIGSQAARILEGSVKGTVAALRAHQTRWTEKLANAKTKKEKEEAEAKIADYELRIGTIIAGAGVPALPAPTLVRYREAIIASVGDINEQILSERDIIDSFEKGRPVEEVVADYTKINDDLKARAEWSAAVKAGYKEKTGEDLGRGVFVPIQWYEDGMSAEDAVKRLTGEDDGEEMPAEYDEWVEATGYEPETEDEVAMFRAAFDAGIRPSKVDAFFESYKEKDAEAEQALSLADAVEEAPSPGEILARAIDHETGNAELAEQVREAIDGEVSHETDPKTDRQNRAEQRAKLSNRKRKSAARDFLRDLRLALPEGMIAHAGQGDEWFAKGCTIDEAKAELVKAEEVAASRRHLLSYRKKLSRKGRGEATREFVEAINAKLQAEHGWNLNQALGGVPVEGWFNDGFTPEEAADAAAADWQPEPTIEQVAAAE